MRPEPPETRFMRVLNLIDTLNPDRIIGESGKKELDGSGLGPRLKEFCSIWQEMKKTPKTV